MPGPQARRADLLHNPIAFTAIQRMAFFGQRVAIESTAQPASGLFQERLQVVELTVYTHREPFAFWLFQIGEYQFAIVKSCAQHQGMIR